jgi:hypothetical protein
MRSVFHEKLTEKNLKTTQIRDFILPAGFFPVWGRPGGQNGTRAKTVRPEIHLHKLRMRGTVSL